MTTPDAKSRRAREGDYMGRYQGKNYRSLRLWLCLVGEVDFFEHRHLYGIRRKRQRAPVAGRRSQFAEGAFEADSELLARCADPALLHMQVKGEAGVVAIMKFLYTHAILADITDSGSGDRWCYSTYELAKAALDAWDGTDEPTGWHRHPRSGRRVDAHGNAYVER